MGYYTDRVNTGNNINYIEFPFSKISGITLKIWLNFKEKRGLAHLVEHLLITQLDAPNYIDINGSTDRSHIAIKIMGDNHYVTDMIEDFLRLVTNFRMDETKFNSEKLAVIQEIKQYSSTNFEKFTAISRNIAFQEKNIFTDKVLGNISDIKRLTLDDVNSFLVKHIYGNNISVLIAGNKQILEKIKFVFEKQRINLISERKRIVYTGKENIIEFRNEKKVLNKIDKNKVIMFSMIRKIDNFQINIEKILALSSIFSILNEGKESLLQQLRYFVPELYLFQAIPVFKKDGLYVQIFTSCNYDDVSNIISGINIALDRVLNIDINTFKSIFKNVYYHQHLLFDGVNNSLSAFSKMPYEQEKISRLEDLDVNVTEVFSCYKKLLQRAINEKYSVLIGQF